MTDTMRAVMELEPVFWRNPGRGRLADAKTDLRYEDIVDASDRLERFKPLIAKLFPQTGDGLIESELSAIPRFARAYEAAFGEKIDGELYLKRDSELPIAGSVKARGGIYEVLRHAEALAMREGMLKETDDYAILADEEHRGFFSRYSVAVGSTGNLGIGVGTMASALGFRAIVHMSRDAKSWKKALLRERGAEVVEHDADYGKAVAAGRAQCEGDPYAYFVDDEDSKELFLGYSVAALRLKKQLEARGIAIGPSRRLIVHLPCGVGGAPCGVAFGLKHVFGDGVRCFFAEPTHAPCMLLGLLTGNVNAHVNEYGIDCVTEADGLAVGRPSALAANIAGTIAEGVYTVDDRTLHKLLALLCDAEGIRVEPSAAAGLSALGSIQAGENDVQIAWATGGLLLPDDVYRTMYERGKQLLK